MERAAQDKRWFWATLMFSSISIVAVVFAVWELVENRFYRGTDYATLHYLYITRGIASSLLLAFWAAWFVLQQRKRYEDELHQSRERYRGLLEASPGAVALYDSALRVSEWNAAAERLYGFSKSEMVGQCLPTVPAERAVELQQFLGKVQLGEPVLDVETQRRNKQGAALEVQLSLLPFREALGTLYFLEVTADIRERVRMRQTLLEIEKLTSMGKMAAGTAHHLNTPLAAMLLRLQMMRERSHQAPCAADLERVESGLRFCQHFVQRLLEFSRRTPTQKQPAELAALVQSVVSFLAPPILSKRARVALALHAINGQNVFADSNQLEALFTILISNALDAIPPAGVINIACSRLPQSSRPGAVDGGSGWIEIRITDNGCGIPASDFPHVFEPFFTTKGAGKGTGLGLAIARNIVTEHGGSIRLQSTPEQGTAAIIELPALAEPSRDPGGKA
jgi:PAS domain S-box-containing protein